MKTKYISLVGLKYTFISILILVLPLGYYYFFYVPSQKAYFDNQNFRMLGDMSQQVKLKIESYRTTIHNAATEWARTDTSWAIRDAGMASEIKSNILTSLKVAPDLKIIKHLLIVSPGTGRYKEFIKDQNDDIDKKLQFNGDKNYFSNLKINIELKKDGYFIHFKYVGIRTEETDKDTTYYTVEIHAKTNIDAILRPILSKSNFDDVLLLGTRERVIYQQSKNEFLATGIDSNFAKLNFHNSDYSDVNLTNIDYKLYVQPIQLSLKAFEPNYNQDNVEWMLMGLVKKDRFNSESQAISYNKILIFIFLVLLLFVSLPLFKLAAIGPGEELKLNDTLFTILSLHIGTALITFFLLSSYSNYKDKTFIDKNLNCFSYNMLNNFKNELDNVNKQLNSFSQNKWKYKRANEGRVKSIISRPMNYNLAEEPYPYFDLVYWIDGDGMQLEKWASDELISPLINVSKRGYFYKIKYKQLWTKSGKDDTLNFTLEPIYSWSSGLNRAVFSVVNVYNPNFEVAAMSTRLTSLLNPIVAPGYGFCIVDQQGKVLFHIDENKNLRENFFTECDDNAKLLSSVFARVEKYMNVRYLGREHRIYLRPVDNMPWTLITYFDKKHLTVTSVNILTIAGTLYIPLFLLLTLLLGLVYFFRNVFHPTWIWPDKNRIGSYKLLIVAFLFLVLLFYRWIFSLDQSKMLLLSYIVPAFVAIFSYLIQQRDNQFLNKKIKVFFLPLNIVFFISLFFALLLLLVKAYVGSIILIFVGIILSSQKITTSIDKLNYRSFQHIYVLAGVLSFFLMSILPAILFFKIAYDDEMINVIKHGQMNIMQRIEKNAQKITKYYLNEKQFDNKFDVFTNLIEKRLDFNSRNDIYQHFFFKTDSWESRTAKMSSDSSAVSESANQSPDDNNYSLERLKRIEQRKIAQIECKESRIPKEVSMFAEFRIPFLKANSERLELFYGKSADNLWTWKKSTSDSLLLLHKKFYQGSNDLFISSKLRKFFPPNWPTQAIVLILVSVLLYLIILFILQKAFAVKFEPFSLTKAKDLTLLKISRCQLIISTTGIETSSALRDRPDVFPLDLFSENNSDKLAELLDFLMVPEDKIILIDHFEHKITDTSWNKAKLVLLEKLIFTYKRTVVLVSSVDPMLYLVSPRVITEDKVDDIISTEGLKARWAQVLNHFEKIHAEEPADDQKIYELLREMKKIISSKNSSVTSKGLRCLAEQFEKECNVNLRLQKIGESLINSPNFAPANYDELISSIIYSAEFYYRAIWTACSKEEKLVLIHLARNGFMNSKNLPIIRQLYFRKLIIKDKAYQLMNESFRRFVLNAEPARDIRKIEAEVGGKSWVHVRIPLFVMLGVLAIFIIYGTQQNILTSAMAWISGLAAGVPAILKFISSFRFGKIGVKTGA